MANQHWKVGGFIPAFLLSFYLKLAHPVNFPQYLSLFYLFPGDPLKYQVSPNSFFFFYLCDTSRLFDFYIHYKNIINILAGFRCSHIHHFPLDTGIKIFWYCPNSLRRLHSPLSPYHMKSHSIALAPRGLHWSVLNFSIRTLCHSPAVSCKCLQL